MIINHNEDVYADDWQDKKSWNKIQFSILLGVNGLVSYLFH